MFHVHLVSLNLFNDPFLFFCFLAFFAWIKLIYFLLYHHYFLGVGIDLLRQFDFRSFLVINFA